MLNPRDMEIADRLCHYLVGDPHVSQSGFFHSHGKAERAVYPVGQLRKFAYRGPRVQRLIFAG